MSATAAPMPNPDSCDASLRAVVNLLAVMITTSRLDEKTALNMLRSAIGKIVKDSKDPTLIKSLRITKRSVYRWVNADSDPELHSATGPPALLLDLLQNRRLGLEQIQQELSLACGRRIDLEETRAILQECIQAQQIVGQPVEGHPGLETYTSAQAEGITHLPPQSVEEYRARLLRKFGLSAQIIARLLNPDPSDEQRLLAEQFPVYRGAMSTHMFIRTGSEDPEAIIKAITGAVEGVLDDADEHAGPYLHVSLGAAARNPDDDALPNSDTPVSS